MLLRRVALLLLPVLACTKVENPSSPADPSEPEPDPKPVTAAQDTRPAPNPVNEPSAASVEPLALRCDGPALAAAFSSLDRASLETLADAGEGASTRLLARWEAERSFDPDGKRTPASVSAFVTHLESELGHAPPAWWVDALSSGKRLGADRDGPAVYDAGLRNGGDLRGAWARGPAGREVRPHVAALLTAADGKIFFDLSMGRVELGPVPETSSIEVARGRGGSTIYYATFDRGAGGFRFPLRAVASDGTVRWSAEVCGPGRQFLGGLAHMTVEIVVLEPSSDSAHGGMKLPAADPTGIAVFTAEGHGIALDVIDPKTGAHALAWSSELWFARHAAGG